ncbi:hypothetical protein D9758_008471 [Tetrapyrgos nigripes]|uniref:Aminoglycoside phosphotransferase domain-containing protein n=1 Tax=Tetrapyrgos nigripes TaxID=182062 RepID=A0A8H5CQP3_9AGAR|nr:hypothetical protein D9758_008471 [Tetrapyrgos nigripes]
MLADRERFRNASTVHLHIHDKRGVLLVECQVMSLYTTRTSDLWLPHSYQDLNDLPSQSIIYEPALGGSKVVRTAPGVLIKYRGDLAEEVICLRYVQEKLSVRLPRVLHHPGDPTIARLWDPLAEPRPRVWYLCMDEIPGTPLHKVIDTLSPQQLDHIASQLKAILSEMHAIKAPHVGSVSGGPFRNQYFYLHSIQPKHAWTTVDEFIDHFRQLLMSFGTEKYTKELLDKFPRDGPVYFTHGDLVPQNILVNASTITGIIDWSTAGFYPEFWEYCRMYEEAANFPNWNHVLGVIYPMPCREEEISAFHRLRGALEYNL